MTNKKTLLEDIARHLNVSKTLVSMVINGKGNTYGISKKTQQLVLDKAAELEYTPNIFARALRTGKSNLIALLVADISNPFYSLIAKHIEKTLADKGYNLMICSTDENIEKEEKLIQLFAEQQMIDGLILSTTNTNGEFLKKERLKNFPIVFIDRYLPNTQSNYVVANNYQGSYNLTEVLLKKGCENIFAFNITPSHISSLTDRINGFKDCLQKNNVALTTEQVVEISYNNIDDDVRKKITKLLKQKQKPDAIYALNNHIAIAVLKVINELNFNCEKEKLTIACFDDIMLFDVIKQPIISVAQPLEQIGVEAANLALTLIDEKLNETKEFRNISLATSIINRG